MSAESVESLHHAIKRGDTLHIAHYLESGGDANRRGKFGTTLLMFAAQEGQTPIIDLLLRAGADINGTSEHSYRAISLAALAGHTRVVEHLLERGALVPDDAAGMPLLGLLRHYGAKRQRIIALLQARASTSNHP
jgi:ankyrin repeat protein